MIPPFRREFDAARTPADALTALGYATGPWTPVLTFATPGDLSIAYTARPGVFVKIGRLVFITFDIITSSFTHTTASGSLQITGLPYKSANVSNQHFTGGLIWAGITKAGFTQISPRINSNAQAVDFLASASGSAVSAVAAADMPTGGSVQLRCSMSYLI